MNSLLQLSEIEYKSAIYLSNEGLYHPACTHLQQALEKYIKGILYEERCAFSKSHDIMKLVEELTTVFRFGADIRIFEKEFKIISELAKDFRYPEDLGDLADENYFLDILDIYTQLKRFIDSRIKLEDSLTYLLKDAGHLLNNNLDELALCRLSQYVLKEKDKNDNLSYWINKQPHKLINNLSATSSPSIKRYAAEELLVELS